MTDQNTSPESPVAPVPPEVPKPAAEKGCVSSAITFITSSLPNLFYLYEKLCKIIASDGVHNLGFFVSTYFCGPAGLYVWQSRLGHNWFSRLWRAILAWVILAFGVILFYVGVGWAFGLLPLILGRPFHWIVRKLRIARPVPSPEVPSDLTFKIGYVDVAALIFIGFIFFVMISNRDDLLRMDHVYNSDPAYHMAAARQIAEKGHIPDWDRWEYAPFGRPHLYPPLLHVMIAFLSGSPDNVLFGFNTIEMLLFPLALLSAWYFARWYLGPAWGFAALIILSMDTSFLISQAMVLPAAIVTLLIPPILLCFLTRKTAAVIILLGASFYLHLGMPFMVMAGLLVLSVRYRDYFPFFRKITAFAGLFYLPWIFKMLPYMDWLGSATGAIAKGKGAAMHLLVGIAQLQIINPLLLIIALIVLFKAKDTRLGPLKCILIGFLPMLLSYGGRFFMHTWPIWAVFAARPFGNWLGRAWEKVAGGDLTALKSLRRRVIALYAFSLIPFPVVAVGIAGGVGLMPGITGLNASLALAAWKSNDDPDFVKLADFVKKTLPPVPISDKPPGEKWKDKTFTAFLASPEYAELKKCIVHVGDQPFGTLYFGDRLVTATGCRVDTGGWGPEVRSQLMVDEVNKAREEDPECLFAFYKEKAAFTPLEIALLKGRHRLDWVRQFGEKYLVGGRGLKPYDEPAGETRF